MDVAVQVAFQKNPGVWRQQKFLRERFKRNLWGDKPTALRVQERVALGHRADPIGRVGERAIRCDRKEGIKDPVHLPESLQREQLPWGHSACQRAVGGKFRASGPPFRKSRRRSNAPGSADQKRQDDQKRSEGVANVIHGDGPNN